MFLNNGIRKDERAEEEEEKNGKFGLNKGCK